MRTLFLVCVTAVLAACSTAGIMFKNRIACTVDGKQGYLVSLYGSEGIATTIDPTDTAIICVVPVTKPASSAP